MYLTVTAQYLSVTVYPKLQSKVLSKMSLCSPRGELFSRVGVQWI